jgi:hypothetical protein
VGRASSPPIREAYFLNAHATTSRPDTSLPSPIYQLSIINYQFPSAILKKFRSKSFPAAVMIDSG